MGSGRAAHITMLTLLLLVCASGAQAYGYWDTEYDFAPSSTNTTINPGGTFVELLSGTINVRYSAASSGAPLISARLMGGNTHLTISQPAGVLTVTGTTNVAISPPPSGTPGVLGGTVLSFEVVANSTTTGFLHCYDATGPGGFCSIFFGTPASNSIPQNMSGPFTFPVFNFTMTAGVGDFTAPTVTQYPQAQVTTKTKYIGREISRVWVDVVGAPTMGLAGSTVLIAGLLLSGWKASRRRG